MSDQDPPRDRGDDDRPRRNGGGREGAPGRRNDRQRRDDDRRGSDAQRPRRDGDRPRYDRDRNDRPRRDGERPRYEGDRPRRDGDRPRRDGDRPRYDRDRNDRPRRDGERPRYEGDRPRRDGDRPRRDGDRPRYDRDRPRQDRDRPRYDRDRNDRPRYDGDRPRYDGDRSGRDDRREYRSEGGRAPRGGTRGGGRSDRGGRDREFTEAERLQHELRPVRAEHDDPVLPDEVTPADLHPGARNQLKTLQPETQEFVARHLAMVNALLEEDPELAHQHAISASRRAGRIPVAREMLALTAYRTGDYALALRELRTYRRLSGSQGNIALMVEAERALGRPQKAIETGLEADTAALNAAQRAQLAVAMSGARLDLGQTLQALYELEIRELDPDRAYSYSPELFAAYAAVLEDLGRDAEAKAWRLRAEAAETALDAQLAADDELEVFEVYEHAADRREEASETAADDPAEDADAAAEDPAVGADAERAAETGALAAEAVDASEGAGPGAAQEGD